jgi:hypothetical protein
MGRKVGRERPEKERERERERKREFIWRTKQRVREVH